MLEDLINKNKILIFTNSANPHCQKVISDFPQIGVDVQDFRLDNATRKNWGEAIHNELESKTGERALPSIFIGGNYIGSYNEFMTLNRSGRLKQMITQVFSVKWKGEKHAQIAKERKEKWLGMPHG